MPDDPVADTLAEAKRIADGLQFACRLPGKTPDFTACGGPAAEAYWAYFTPARVASLLAVVEAALRLHVPEQETVYRACAEHVLTKTLHDRERFSKMAACPDCATVPHRVCAHCECPNDEWPCPTYRAITTALAGKEADRG